MSLLEFILLFSITLNASQIPTTNVERGSAIDGNQREVQSATRLPKVDPREDILRQFFERRSSSLGQSARTFISVADRYELDYTLLPAISGVESGLEKAGNTTDFNPFGYMCPGGPCRFDSFEQAIERVGKTIGTSRTYAPYRRSGEIIELAKIYNQVSPDDWTWKIKSFQEKIR